MNDRKKDWWNDNDEKNSASAAGSLHTLATAACAKNETEQPSGTLKATNDAVDFYFYYPDTWQVYLDTGMIAVKPTPSSSGIVGTSISVSAFELDGEAAGQGVNDYWDSYKGTLEKTFSDYALEGESELKLDGVPCRPPRNTEAP